MAHYWLPDATSGTGTGNWTATGATGHWADDAAGTNLGKAAPGAGDSVLFGAAAFNGAGQVVTVDATAYCLDMDWTGATNTPTLAHSAEIFIHGVCTGVAGMVHAGTSRTSFSGTGTHNITWGTNWTGSVLISNGGTRTFQDALVISGILSVQAGTVVTGNFGITCTGITLIDAYGKTLTLSSSIIACTSWAYSGSNLTVTANTAVINVSGTGAGSFGAANYNGCSFNFIGTAHTLSGSPTGIKTMRWGRAAGVQTITGTAAMVLNVPRLLAVNGRNVLTIASTGAAWTITGNSGYFEGNYMSISNVTAGYTNTYYAGTNSTNGGGNIKWIFRGPVRAVRRHGRW